MTKRNHTLILMCIVFVTVHLSAFAQDFLWVSGEGKLIDYPPMPIYGALPSVIHPKVKPNTRSITVNRYLLVNTMGELRRWADRDGQYIMHYDTTGRLVQIQGSPNDIHGTNFIYDGERVVEVDGNYGCRFLYDATGKLKTMHNMHNSTFQYTLDKNGNITKIDEYAGSKLFRTHYYSFDKQGRKAEYHAQYGIWKFDIVQYFNNVGDVATIMYYEEQERIDGGIQYIHNEYRFEYGLDGNLTRCVEIVIGDVAYEKRGFEYEYTYEFYPTKEELERQAEEERRIKAEEEERQRIATLKQSYSSCRFLFESEEAFESYITKPDVEDKIIERMGDKIDELSRDVRTGKELCDPNKSIGYDMLRLCNISVPGSIISSYRENKLKVFVTERKALNKAYKKSATDNYTVFLRNYILNNKTHTTSTDKQTEAKEARNKALLGIGFGVAVIAIPAIIVSVVKK